MLKPSGRHIEGVFPGCISDHFQPHDRSASSNTLPETYSRDGFQLAVGISHHGIHFGATYGERTLAVLPMKLQTRSLSSIDVLTGVRLKLSHNIGNGDLGENANEQVSMVIAASNSQSLALEIAGDPSHDPVEVGIKVDIVIRVACFAAPRSAEFQQIKNIDTSTGVFISKESEETIGLGVAELKISARNAFAVGVRLVATGRQDSITKNSQLIVTISERTDSLYKGTVERQRDDSFNSAIYRTTYRFPGTNELPGDVFRCICRFWRR